MPEKRLVFDAGLHRGEDTAFYLARGYRVVAFEANPDLVEHCARRFADAIGRGDLTIVSGAITAPDGPPTLTFYKNRKTVWGTTSSAWKERNDRLFSGSIEITVPAVDFAQCLRVHGTPYFAKVDIEGADRLVLATLCALDTPPDFISIESEKVDFARLIADFDTLRAGGYRRFKIVQQATIPGSRFEGYRFEEHASGPFGNDLKGEWLDIEQAIERYRAIFRAYRRFGDGSAIGRWGRPITKPLARLLNRGLPGWHDLHAAR